MSPGPIVALVTAAGVGDDDTDAPLLCAALVEVGIDPRIVVWDDPDVDWASHDLVVVRSTWDYSLRREEFLAWADATAAVTCLQNPPGILRWNTDKHYLDDLAADGVPTVPTLFLDHGASTPDADRLLAVDPGVGAHGCVVKPSVSAGARDTARYLPGSLDGAVDHARRLLDEGRGVMVQPYLPAVEHLGETGIVLFDGRPSHAFAKAALLRDGHAVTREMFAPETIRPRPPDPSESALAAALVDILVERHGDPPLYARVDLLPGPDGEPVLSELELTEPSFFLEQSPGAAAGAAAAIRAAVTRT